MCAVAFYCYCYLHLSCMEDPSSKHECGKKLSQRTCEGAEYITLGKKHESSVRAADKHKLGH